MIANTYVMSQVCVRHEGISAVDGKDLQRMVFNVLNKYDFDRQRMNAFIEGQVNKYQAALRGTGDPRWRGPGGTSLVDYIKGVCHKLPAEIAESRSKELHDAQMAALTAQAAAARAQTEAAYASQLQLQSPIFVPPPLAQPQYNPNSFYVAPIQQPVSNQIRCINAGIYTNCRY
jgi:multidrug efflux pump subunit AcrA (membrane-fusion protein)